MWIAAKVRTIPEVSISKRRCPYYGQAVMHKHGSRLRKLRDWVHHGAVVERLRCPACGRSQTVYPEGVEMRVQRSQRARQLGILLYAFGLSYRGVSNALGYLGVAVSPATILRDVVRSGQHAQIAQKRELLRGKVKVRRVGVDGTGVPMAGKPDDKGVVVVVDQESGTGLLVEALDEQNQQEITSLLEQVFRLFQPEEVVTDEAGVYTEAIEQAAASTGHLPKHLLCATHFRKNKARRLRALCEEAKRRGLGLLVMELRAMLALLRSPPATMGAYAERLYRSFLWAKPPRKNRKTSWAYQVKMLSLEIWEKSKKVTGATNNRTEQLIGRAFKVRVRSMRGFKKEENRMCFLALRLLLDQMQLQNGDICLA